MSTSLITATPGVGVSGCPAWCTVDYYEERHEVHTGILGQVEINGDRLMVVVGIYPGDAHPNAWLYADGVAAWRVAPESFAALVPQLVQSYGDSLDSLVRTLQPAPPAPMRHVPVLADVVPIRRGVL